MVQPNTSLPAQKWPPISVAQAHAISAMTDPVRRNLRITQGYHDLKVAFTRLFGPTNVTWCAYAAWASKSAGRFIRGEVVPGMIRECLSYAAALKGAIERANAMLGRLYKGTSLDDLFLTTTIDSMIRDITTHVGQ